MRNAIRLSAAVLVVAVLASAGCSEDQKRTAMGTYEEAVENTTEIIENTAYYWKKKFSETDVCDLSEQNWVDFVGGAAVGTSVTGAVAGESALVLMTSTGIAVLTAPAVATGVTIAAGSAAATYGAVKAYCASK